MENEHVEDETISGKSMETLEILSKYAPKCNQMCSKIRIFHEKIMKNHETLFFDFFEENHQKRLPCDIGNQIRPEN